MRACTALKLPFNKKDKLDTGFSLIEILISLAIISLIASIIIPSFSQHLVNARRIQAEVSLSKMAAALEQYAVVHNTYQHANLENLHVETNDNYLFTIALATDTDFLLNAQPLQQQASRDTQCATLSLDSHGKKGISGNSTIKECW